MKKLVLGVVGAASFSIFANVGVFNGSGQTPIAEKTDAIQMVEEEVVMTPRKAQGPVTTACENLDPMDYRCTFLLRNLKSTPVELQVGFPLDLEPYRMSSKSAEDVEELVALFNFTARRGNEKFQVRFVPYDKEKHFSKLFLWTMKFAPNEEQTLVISYTMEGYLGLDSTYRANSRESRDDVDTDSLLTTLFDVGIGEAHIYVTGTATCWAGEIEKATFKYYSQEFESYLAKRGAYDETDEDRKNRLAALSKKVANMLLLLKPDIRMVRNWSPTPEKWMRKDDGNGRFHYEMTFAPFRPSKGDSIQLRYVAPPMPTEPDEVAIIDESVRKISKAKGDQAKQYLRDAKDVVLEFYGIKTDNPRIATFVRSQCWSGQDRSDKLSPALRKRLEK